MREGRPKLIKIIRDNLGNAVCRVCEKEPEPGKKLRAGLCRTCRHLLSRLFPFSRDLEGILMKVQLQGLLLHRILRVYTTKCAMPAWNNPG